jgi:hypothetical protein
MPHTVRTTPGRLTSTQVHRLACEGTPFEAASMRGVEGYWDTGQLDREWADFYRSQRDRIRYTVLNYTTPVAWLLREGWVVVGPLPIEPTGVQSITRGLYPRAPLPKTAGAK